MTPEAPNLRPEAFRGTAEAYVRYRPLYPQALLRDLLVTARIPERAVLVDLASGPGRIALDLAASFEAVIAIDQEPEMVAIGREEAARRGVANVSWSVGRAEEAERPAASVDLITIGEAFHRLDQEKILHLALAWLKPGGCLATMGPQGFFEGEESWKRRLAKVARMWFPAGAAEGRLGAELGPQGPERAIRRTGFVEVATHEFAVTRELSFDEIAGYLRSTSVCSERVLGEKLPMFLDELRQALGEAPEALFRETTRWSYTLGRKP
jgi:SAM-dependent methyltransferase